MGAIVPVVVAFHASFKFNGLAGIAWWIMFPVAGSGGAGRCIFVRIPRSRNSAELSLQFEEPARAPNLGAVAAVRPADLAHLFRLPSAAAVTRVQSSRFCAS